MKFYSIFTKPYRSSFSCAENFVTKAYLFNAGLFIIDVLIIICHHYYCIIVLSSPYCDVMHVKQRNVVTGSLLDVRLWVFDHQQVCCGDGFTRTDICSIQFSFPPSNQITVRRETSQRQGARVLRPWMSIRGL